MEGYYTGFPYNRELFDLEGWFKRKGTDQGGCYLRMWRQHIFLPEDLVTHLQEVGRCTLNRISDDARTTIWTQGGFLQWILSLKEDGKFSGLILYMNCSRPMFI
jgi:hypothetical protein